MEKLKRQDENYILPFLWLRGESEDIIRREIAMIHESGIGAVCVESRPHPDFVGDGWWRDMDIVMDEARKRGMRVWVLDDEHFPTGYAAGRIRDLYPELRKWYLDCRYVDVLGPVEGSSVLIHAHVGEDEKLTGVVAARYNGQEGRLTGELQDLTQKVVDGVLYWDIPEGFWRVFILVMTRKDSNGRVSDYLNPIDAKSVKVLIDAVYEPHYRRYKEDFGKTFAGFFSDEPGFYNIWSHDASIGRFPMVLPWRGDMADILRKESGMDIIRYLPCLWYDAGEKTNYIRYLYMDTVSRLYSECFCDQIGEWCRKHGIEYIGHVIEDNNAHARLGAGAGHFFRSQWGQDMSGIDVVYQQVLPGFDVKYRNVTRIGDGEFYHYALAKMASSLGHLDPKKKGRTMCEIFGAYGWYEGLKLMKWLTDHMLVRGVNHFVPHAFSAADFPDPDCPPHFYAHGRNPQFRYFKHLMMYMNRLCHLLNNGTHIAPVAVLYHAEAEWSGDYMLFQKPAKMLMQNQIDFDVVPADILKDNLLIENGELCIGNERYKVLVIPYAQRLPKVIIERLYEAVEKGLPVYFIDGLPSGASEGCDVKGTLDNIARSNKAKVVLLDQLAAQMRSSRFNEITVDGNHPYLRYYHYRRGETDIFMFFNEHPCSGIETEAEVQLKGVACEYDAFNNTCKKLSGKTTNAGTKIPLHLSHYESKIIIFNGCQDVVESRDMIEARSMDDFAGKSPGAALQIDGAWKISTAKADEYPQFNYKFNLERLTDLSRSGYLPGFSGTIRYETSFEWDAEADEVFMDLGDAYETVEIWLNGRNEGVRICPPYSFNITKSIAKGTNKLIIDVTNTLVKEYPDELSRFRQQEPSGLMGPVNVKGYRWGK